ncbi:MAG TPA: N-acetyltransferase, partial [Anaerovoracaceae bacterium]|nr:N-acetyltransferase [Anaerovoracaceae bacterium]
MMTHVGTMTAETDRLLLRKFDYSDDESMLKNWVADEKVQSMYAEPTYTTKESVRGLLDKYISGY